MTRKKAGALLLAALLFGCTRDPLPVLPTTDRLHVHGVLEAGADTVSVHLGEIRVRSRDPSLEPRPLSGALVELTWGGGTLRLREAPEGFGRCRPQPPSYGPIPVENPATHGQGCYAAVVPGGVRAGERYELRVSLPDGRVVRGAAQLPESPELVRSLAEPRVDVVSTWRGLLETEAPIVLRWQVSPAVAGLTVSVASEAVFHPDGALPGDACYLTFDQWNHTPWIRQVIDPLRTDSIAQRLIVMGCSSQTSPTALLPDSLHVRFQVAAVDSAFVRYLRLIDGSESVRLRDASVGLEGAVGVFAGIAPVEQRLMLITRPRSGE